MAILAGVAIALVVSLLLNILGVAIGLAILDPQNGDQARGLGIGGMIWWLVASIIALFVGGWVAGRLAGVPRRLDGAVHGAVTWAVTTLFTIYLITSAVGTIIGGTFRVLGQTAEVAGQVAGPMVQEEGVPRAADANWERVSMEVRQALRATDAPLVQRPQLEQRADQLADAARQRGEGTAAVSAGQAYQEMMALLLRLSRGSQDQVAQQDRQAAVRLLVTQGQVAQAQAEQRVEQWSTALRGPQETARDTAQEIGRRVRESGDEALDVSTAAAFSAFVMLLLTAVAGVLGGMLGAPMHLILEERREERREEIREEHEKRPET